MNKAMRMMGLLAVGWLLLGATLLQSLGPLGFTLAFGTIVFAESLSGVLFSMAVSQKEGHRLSPSDAVARLLLGWVMFCLGLIICFQMGLLPFYQGQPSAGLSLLGLSLILGLLKLSARVTAFGRTLLVFRYVVAAAVLKGVLIVGGSDVDLLLSATILSHLLVLFVVFISVRRRLRETSNVADRAALDPVVWYSDLLIVPLVLGGADALLYLAVRYLLIGVTELLTELGRAARPALRSAREGRNQMAFITSAARLNLGFLLVGGGAALAALAAGPYLADALHQSEANVQTVLVWAALGACAPVIFGATDTLLAAVGKRSIGRLFSMVTFSVFAVAVTTTHAPNAAFVAQCFAALHLFRVAAAAILLARFAGVWPGLTALLLRQIRLF